MYTVKVEFKIAIGSEEEQLDLINLLLGSWRMNGQVLGREFPIAQTKGAYTAFVQTPDKDSLGSQFNNKYVRKNLHRLDEKFTAPQVSLLGKDPNSSSLCECISPSSYILYTTYLSTESPLKCGDCFSEIPLYKIPKTFDDEYYNILHWVSDFQNCDHLQMNCTVGERFALNQLSNLSSPLTKEGLSVRDSIQDVTGKKTFYYLYKGSGRNHESEIARKCPSCGGEWFLEERFHGIFDFVCKGCALLSNIAWNCR